MMEAPPVPYPLNKIQAAPTPPQLTHDLQNEVGHLLNRYQRGFPGGQPVSFQASHLEELKSQDYWVCEKTDGSRYLMYLTHDGGRGDQPPEGVVYLIDRRNEYFFIDNMQFPMQSGAHATVEYQGGRVKVDFHVETLLDGELVEDRYPDGTTRLKFLVFDALVVDGKDLTQRTLDKRMAYAKTFIIQPYQKWLKNDARAREAQLFTVEDKQIEFAYAMDKMFKEIIPKVKKLHGNDGLIFTCVHSPYQSGTDPHILKWKPPEENTVDFLMHMTFAQREDSWDGETMVDYSKIPRIELFIHIKNGVDYRLVDELYVTEEDWESMTSLGQPLQDSIVECWQEQTEHTARWRFHRLRTDKDDSNHVSVYDSVIQSINDHVTEQTLMNRSEEIRVAWKARPRNY